jgi:hypothetical protein
MLSEMLSKLISRGPPFNDQGGATPIGDLSLGQISQTSSLTACTNAASRTSLSSSAFGIRGWAMGISGGACAIVKPGLNSETILGPPLKPLKIADPSFEFSRSCESQ